MSLVEVSPSTLIMLKVSATSPESARCSISLDTDASVVRKTSMVAMSGWIIPEPFAMPPSLHTLPPRVNSTATCLLIVSVVMMASAASLPSRESAALSSGTP